jgi:hypothetical protein
MGSGVSQLLFLPALISRLCLSCFFQFWRNLEISFCQNVVGTSDSIFRAEVGMVGTFSTYICRRFDRPKGGRGGGGGTNILSDSKETANE